MLNFFNNNILPLSEELQEMLDLKELRDDKIRSDAELEALEAKLLKEESDGCDE